MSMVDLQAEFAQAAADLIQEVRRRGWQCTLGDAYRDPRVHGEFGMKEGYGRARSVHKLRLAIDLNLFIDGEWRTDTESHRPLGEWWMERYKTRKARWGGAWNDGNHYSFEVWGSA